MIKLSKEHVILLHERLIETTGGSNGIRDDGMLDSALANPFSRLEMMNYILVYKQKQHNYALEL